MNDKNKLNQISGNLDLINNKINNIQYQLFQSSQYENNSNYMDFLYDNYTESLIESFCQIIGD